MQAPDGGLYFEDFETHTKHIVRSRAECANCVPPPTGCSAAIQVEAAYLVSVPIGEDFRCDMLSGAYVPEAAGIKGIIYTSTTVTTSTVTTTTPWSVGMQAEIERPGTDSNSIFALPLPVLILLLLALVGLCLWALAKVGRKARRRRQQSKAARDDASSSSDGDDEEALKSHGQEKLGLLAAAAASTPTPSLPPGMLAAAAAAMPSPCLPPGAAGMPLGMPMPPLPSGSFPLTTMLGPGSAGPSFSLPPMQGSAGPPWAMPPQPWGQGGAVLSGGQAAPVSPPAGWTLAG